jgi:hypothetical protein
MTRSQSRPEFEQVVPGAIERLTPPEKIAVSADIANTLARF